MNINRTNYESFLIDYVEGLLSSDQQKEVEVFLLANPDIKEEFEAFSVEEFRLPDVVFEEKEQLKKIPFEKTSAHSEYFQQQCVAKIEKLLTPGEEKWFNELIATDPEKQKIAALFSKTILPSEPMVFNEKLLLKKGEIIHQIDQDLFEEYCVACVEGWLDQSGLIALNEYIQNHPEQKRILDLYYHTRLIPDSTIVFPDKKRIKKFQLFSARNRKLFAYASSAAAILLFSAMFYYAQKAEDASRLASSISVQQPAQKSTDVKSKEAQNKSNIAAASVKKSILSDPFGFKKLSSASQSNKIIDSKTERISLEFLRPITAKEVNCIKCKDLSDQKVLAVLSSTNEANILIANAAINEPENSLKPGLKDRIEAANSPEVLWDIAQAGITGINRVSNSNLELKKKEEQEKTKIEFNSRFFAFSTNVKKKN